MQDTLARRPGAASRPDRQRNWLLIALVVALIVALVIGVVAIAGYFVLTRPRSDQWTWQSPTGAVDITRVRPDIAVITLTGDPPAPTVQEALAAGEPDSAYATLVFSTQLTDAERVGQLLPVAKAFEAVNSPDLAALSYQQLHSLAALSVTLSDYERARASLDAAEGFVRLGKKAAARPSLAQAEALALYSPLLAPVQRQEITQRLVRIYQQAGLQRESAEAVRALRQPQGLPDARRAVDSFLRGLQGQFTAPEQLVLAEQERKRQAVAFIQAWDASAGADIEAARAALAGVLLQEDGLREATFAAALGASLPLPDQAAVLQAKIDWLTTKWMIASGAMGFNLVPEWQVAEPQVAAALKLAYEQLFANYEQQIAQLPAADEVNLARVEVLRQQLLAARLGLYPDYLEDNLALKLRAAQEAAADRLPLLVIDEPWGRGRVFRLSEAFQ